MSKSRQLSEKKDFLSLNDEAFNMVGDVNIQQMTGADKRIENYERMVGNLFVGQTMTPQKVATYINRRPIMNSQNIRK